MEIKFYGVRGSIASPSVKNFDSSKYGGNTTCIEIIANGNSRYIIDGGTGLRLLGNEYMGGDFGKGKGKAHMFFTHVHWDHIQGVPFFIPFFIRGNDFKLHGAKKVNSSLEQCLEHQQQYPNFPVTLEQMRQIGANLEFYDLASGSIDLEGDVKISFTELFHPDGVFSYKFEDDKSKIVIATDNEHDGELFFNKKFGPNDEKLINWARDANILVYDGQYTPEEYRGEVGGLKKGWGHSTYEKGIDIASEANVSRLVLTHHDPSHDDKELDKILDRAKKYAKGKRVFVSLACEGRSFDII